MMPSAEEQPPSLCIAPNELLVTTSYYQKERGALRPSLISSLVRFIDRINAGKQSWRRCASTVFQIMLGKQQAPSRRDSFRYCLRINTHIKVRRDKMKLREIVDDVELQRVAMLKNNAKRAQKQYRDAQARLKIAKAKQAMLRAQVQSPTAS